MTRTTKRYLTGWSAWPALLVFVGIAQVIFGNGVFGYWVVWMSLVIAVGSVVTGVVGLVLVHTGALPRAIMPTALIALWPLLGLIIAGLRALL